MPEGVPLWQPERERASLDGGPSPDLPSGSALSESTPSVPFIPAVAGHAALEPRPVDELPEGRPVERDSRGRRRLLSLDVIRGIAVVGMILVNNPGIPSLQSPWLAHAPWNGLTLADLVFPLFLFSLGMALALTRGRPAGNVSRRVQCRRVVRRGLTLVGLGLLFHLLIAGNLSTFRIPGVFQRIGICSLLGGLMVIAFSPRAIALGAGALLVGYSALLGCVQAPSFARPDPSAGWPVAEIPFEGTRPEARPDPLSMAGSLPSYVDRRLFGHHLYRPEYDPEGLLTSLPALSTVLIGVLAGLWLGTPRRRIAHLAGFLWAGFGLLGLGGLMSWIFPVNKALWSPSFVLVTGGVALLLFAVLEGCRNVRRMSAWLRPFEVFGANALVAYLASNLLMVVLAGGSVKGTPMDEWIMKSSVLSRLDGGVASLFYGLLHVGIWLPPLWILRQRKLYIKI